MLKRKSFLIISAVVLIAALATWRFMSGRNQVGYKTVSVTKGDIDATVSATGNPNAVTTVQVGTQVSGQVSQLFADFNTKVKKDQLIARIDPEIFQARVNQAQANVDAAKAAVINARATYQKAQADIASARAAVENAKANVAKAKVAMLDAQTKSQRRVEMFKEGIIAAEDRDTAKATYDTSVQEYAAAQAQQKAAEDALNAQGAQAEVAKTQVQTAQAQVEQYQAALRQAQIDLEHTFIRAPVDGTVVSRNVDVGQTVAASLQAPTLFLIAQDLTKMQVDTNVDEADVGQIHTGQAATFTVDAYPNRAFQGYVSQIRQAPINVQNVITYDVVVAVANPDLKLFPGMTANVKIQVDKRSNVLKIPNAALRFRPADAEPGTVHAAQKNGSTIWVLGNDQKPRPVPVKLGITDGRYSEVTEGEIQPGEKVIVGASSKQGGTQQQPAMGRRGPGF